MGNTVPQSRGANPPRHTGATSGWHRDNGAH